MPDKLFMPTHPSSPFSHAYTRTHHQPDSSPPGLTQWACYIKASAYGSRVGWTPVRTIHTYIHTTATSKPDASGFFGSNTRQHCRCWWILFKWLSYVFRSSDAPSPRSELSIYRSPRVSGGFFPPAAR